MKSSEQSITIKPIDQLRVDRLQMLRDLHSLKYFKNPDRPTIKEKISLCSDYTGVTREYFQNVAVKSINKIYSTIFEKLAEYKPSEPKKSIKINGVKYNLVKRFDEMPESWHELVRRSDFENNPIRMASLVYIEDGKKYAEKGVYDTITNPTFKRDEIFELHFPLDLYLDLNDFFLRKLNVLHPLYVKLKAARKLNLQEKMKKTTKKTKKK